MGFFIVLASFVLMQVFQVSRAMQEIEDLGKAFPNCLERCNWTYADLNLKKLMLMFMTNLSNGGIKFSLFGVINANFEAFLKV
jgi:hypothetical protein